MDYEVKLQRDELEDLDIFSLRMPSEMGRSVNQAKAAVILCTRVSRQHGRHKALNPG